MFKYAAILLIFAAGLIHLTIVPDHLSHAPVHGLTFLAIGAAQVLWAIAYVRFWRRTILYWVGLGLSGGIVLLWVLTQLIMPPFAAEPEPIDVATIASKCAEIVAFFALLIFARRLQIFHSSRHIIAGAAVVTLAVGTGMFFAGHAAELLFPQLAHDHTSAAHAHSSDTTAIHLHEETLHDNLEAGHHEARVVETSLHTGGDHAHDQAVDPSINPADVHLHDVIEAGQSEIMGTPKHQDAASGPVETSEASLTEQEALHLSGDHHHYGESANHSTAKAVPAGAENQSAVPDTPQSHLAAAHSHANDATTLPDQQPHSEIITGLETEASTTDHPEASEHTMDGSVDETTSSAAPSESELADYHQDQTAAASGFGPEPAFDSNPSWQQMPQLQPDPGYPALAYPSIQNSPEQLEMFRNRFHSAWSAEPPLIQTQPGW